MRKIVDFFLDIKDSIRDNDSFREGDKTSRFAYIGVGILVVFILIGAIVASTLN